MPAVIGLLIGVNLVALFIVWPLPWPGKFLLLASPLCPQRPAHSVFIGGQQMPIEARMFGMFGGAMLALLHIALSGRLRAAMFPRGRWLALWLALLGVMALDGTQAMLYDLGIVRLYTPNLYLRLGTGLAAGMAITMMFVPLMNQALWREPRRELPVYGGVKGVAVGLGLQAALFVVTLADLPWLLIPLSLLNSLGILVVFAGLTTVLVCLAARRVSQFSSWREVLGPAAAGFNLAALFLLALAVARLALFGPGPITPPG